MLINILLIGLFSTEFHAEVPCQQHQHLNIVNAVSNSYSVPVLEYNQQDCLDPGQSLLKGISIHILNYITSTNNTFVCNKA